MIDKSKIAPKEREEEMEDFHDYEDERTPNSTRFKHCRCCCESNAAKPVAPRRRGLWEIVAKLDGEAQDPICPRAVGAGRTGFGEGEGGAE